ncbi:Asp/Glu/hydantoin racemase [Cohnella xylanilytica]|uniref:maleate cis-trans isomerase family protein n=1 Tax=Cohnella xylanilytica TaxID=557555 RepID=UPI001B02FA6E|nr:aspartate/glutamate racemase family protein [Cohnella xylanilytica]GIO10808.1 Asp/Glu/hydantoin racemase [Cohnella xylanilytica]
MARIGMLTPSSNTVLEPVTSRLLDDLNRESRDGRERRGAREAATAHFARVRVTEISLEARSDGQFADEPMLAAAALLADAKADLLVWNGTSGSWLGLERDLALVRAIEAATGIRATTSSLAMKEAYERLGVRRLGLVTPYADDVNARIAERYRELGLECAPALGCGIRENERFARVPEETIEAMIVEAAGSGRLDAIAVVCTNVNAASLAVRMESVLGIPVLDSVAATAWQALGLLGIDGRSLAGRWGRIFEYG